MKRRFLLLMMMTMIAVQSWGAVGDIITAKTGSAVTKVKDAEGNIVKGTISDAEIGFYKFKVLDETTKTVAWDSYGGTQSEITIPSEFDIKGGSDTYFVVSSGSLFYFNNNIQAITFSEGITEIKTGDVSLQNLYRIYMPSTMTTCSINNYNFWNLRYMEVAKGNTKYWTSDDHTMLFDYAYNKLELKHMTSYTYDKATNTYTPLTELTIPQDVIIVSSINGNDNVTTINIPKSVTSFTNFRYAKLSNLTKIVVDSENKTFANYKPDGASEIDGILYSNDLKTLHRMPLGLYKDGGECAIREGVEKLDNWSLTNCMMISIVLPNSLTTMGSGAIDNCKNLKKVSVGKNVTQLDKFNNCTSLEEINVNPDNQTYKSEDGVLYNNDYSILLRCPPAKKNKTETVNGEEEIVVFTPNSNCTEFSSNAFGSSLITSVDFSKIERFGLDCFRASKLESAVLSSAVIVGDRCFYQCSIKRIELGANVTTLGASLCAGSGGLTSVDLLKATKLTSIPESMFSSCSRLQQLTIPTNITTIGSSFIGNSGVTNLTFTNGSQLTELNASCFKNANNLKTIDLGSGSKLTIIGNECFRNLTKLNKIQIPASVTSIGVSCFNGCTNLDQFSFETGSQIETIDDYAFQDCAKITSIDLSSFDKLTTIGTEAFRRCTALTTLSIPKNVSSIGQKMVAECDNLTKIDVDADNAKYASSAEMLCTKDKKTLLMFPGGKAREDFTLLSPSFEAIAPYAFYACHKLKNIVFPKKITTIGNYAFQFCENLNSITFFGDAPIAITKEEETDPSVGVNDRDHRFGNAHYTSEAKGDYCAADFLKKFVTINVRKNGNESQYNTGYWSDRKAISYSFQKGAFDYMAMSGTTLGVFGTSSTNNTVVVPKTVHHDDLNIDMNVGYIGDYAFENVPSSVKEVVFLGPIQFVGSNAFNNGHKDGVYTENPTSSIESIFFTDYETVGENQLSTKQFELGTAYGTEEYPEFASTQKIYVPKSKVADYKNSWTNFAEQINYQIPFPSISTRYGTFSREFDVDLQDEVDGEKKNPMTESGKPAVVAYTGFVKTYQANDNTYIRMQSINCGGEGDGTYIPANTGVLLEANDKKEVTGNESSPEGFYYRIGEGINSGSSSKSVGDAPNVMACVTETSRTITGKDGDYYNFVISGGKYWSLGDKQEVTIPAHKSYLHIPASSLSSSKSIVLVFDDTNEETGIEIVNGEIVMTSDNAPTYNLMGQHVSRNAKGIVIVNGRKVLRK